MQPPFAYLPDHDMLVQVWEQLFGRQATGRPGLFGETSDGARGEYTVEAIADIHRYLIAKGPP